MPSLNLSSISLKSKPSKSLSKQSPVSPVSDSSPEYTISLPPSYSQISLVPSQATAPSGGYAEMLDEDNMSWGRPPKSSKKQK